MGPPCELFINQYTKRFRSVILAVYLLRVSPFGLLQSSVGHIKHAHIYNRTFYWHAPSIPVGHVYFRYVFWFSVILTTPTSTTRRSTGTPRQSPWDMFIFGHVFWFSVIMTTPTSTTGRSTGTPRQSPWDMFISGMCFDFLSYWPCPYLQPDVLLARHGNPSRTCLFQVCVLVWSKPLCCQMKYWIR